MPEAARRPHASAWSNRRLAWFKEFSSPSTVVDHAAKALELAVTLAKATGSELRILYVASHQPLTQAEQRLAETEYSAEIGAFLGAAQLLPRLAGAPGCPRHTGALKPGHRRGRASGGGRKHPASGGDPGSGADGVAKVTTMMETGDPADVIVIQAQAHKADLVMLGLPGPKRCKGCAAWQRVAQGRTCGVLLGRNRKVSCKRIKGAAIV